MSCFVGIALFPLKATPSRKRMCPVHLLPCMGAHCSEYILPTGWLPIADVDNVPRSGHVCGATGFRMGCGIANWGCYIESVSNSACSWVVAIVFSFKTWNSSWNGAIWLGVVHGDSETVVGKGPFDLALKI